MHYQLSFPSQLCYQLLFPDSLPIVFSHVFLELASFRFCSDLDSHPDSVFLLPDKSPLNYIVSIQADLPHNMVKIP